MTTSSTEKELLALLRQRDADLEERGRLLLKTKVAIEQLQQELSASRKEEEVFKDEARKAYEEQLGQARAIQAQLQLCEEELEARTQDLTRYAAENRNLQVRSSDLEAELDGVRDEANRRIGQLDLANQEQAALLQQQESELHSRRKQVADLEGKLHSRSGALADHSERAKQLQQERDDSEQLVRELMRKTKKLQEEQAAAEQSLKTSAAGVEEARLKLQQAQAAAEAGTRAAKVMDKEWQQRLQQQEQQWALKQKDLEKRWAARLVEAGRQARSHKAAAAEAHQQQVTSLQAQHGNHVRQLQSKAQQMEWQSSNERALLQKHWEGKVAEAIRAEQEKAGQAEKLWQGRLGEVSSDWQAKLAQGQVQWEKDRAAAEQAWREAKSQAEQQWKQQLESIQHAHRQEVCAGEAAAARGRAGVEAKLGALTDRLLHMARKEAKREKRQGELIRAVEELRVGQGAEHSRRRELEGALRESAAIFKRELHDKNLELAALQQQLGTLRSWQGQTLEGISQGLSRSMHPSPDALMQPYSPTVLPQQQQQPYGFPHTHRHSAPLLNLRPATHLRNLASLGSPLATPTWLQGGTFQSPTQRQTHSRPPGMSQRRDESQSAVPRNTMRIPADSGAALRYGPPDPRDSLAIPADYDAGPSNGPSVPNNTLAAPADGMPASGDGEAGAVVQQQDSEEEDRLHVLSGSGVEEEVLEAELQALRAARQQFQRASLSQEQLRKSLLARIADKLEEGGQHPSPSRLVSALSPSRSKAQFEDTIPADRTNQEASSWEAMQPQPEQAQEAAPPSNAPEEDEGDQQHSRLQTWNDELTQRLSAAMGKLEPNLSRRPSRSRSKQSRRVSSSAVS